MTNYTFPYETPALRVEQPLGAFYVAVLPAELLLKVATSDLARAITNPSGSGYQIDGAQRDKSDARLNEIANYINRVDAAFPNSIILAANHILESGFNQGEMEDISEERNKGSIKKTKTWDVTKSDNGFHTLIIPTDAKLAAVVDGQHRLFSFDRPNINPESLRSMNLLCSIFIDLPKALQAQIFATINSTQKRVDRSLTYELFGYNVSDESEKHWAPEKLAVFLTRKLATEKDSPLRGRITLAPKRDKTLEKLSSTVDWRVSTAVIVDGILRLFSSRPRHDADSMHQGKPRLRSVLKHGRKDKSPLREVYIEGNDVLIYTMVLNYLKASNDVFWNEPKDDSVIFRTIGVQAIFDILRKIAKKSYQDKNISVEYFTNKIEEAREIDFSDVCFQNFSGSGRSFIRNKIEEIIFNNK